MQVQCQKAGRPTGIINVVWCEQQRRKLAYSGISYTELRTRLGNQLSVGSLKNKLWARTGMTVGEMKAIEQVIDCAVREAADKVGLL